ncbi:MAG: Mur ligase family protein, partial [Fervidobacterium pennivorans]
MVALKLGRIIDIIEKFIVKLNISDDLKNVEVESIANNSSKVGENALFICRKGSRFDSHTIVEKVFRENKIVAFITENEIRSDLPYIQVYDSRLTEAYIAAEFYEHPDQHLITFGVTGTNGKTTCAHLFHHVMQQFGLNGSLSGTVLNDILGDKFYVHNTTPDALTIFENMFKTYKKGGSYYSMEVSSHSL